MIANYFTLRHLALDLNKRLAGRQILEGFCQTKNEAALTFAGEHNETLIVSCEPSANYLFLREPVSRARRNSVDILTSARGEHVESVIIRPADRELIVQLVEGRRMVIQLFGSRANVLLIDAGNRIVDAFLRPKELIGSPYVQHPPASSAPPVGRGELRAHFRTIGHVLVAAALKKFFPLFNPMLVRELCVRSSIPEQAMTAELSDHDIERIYDTSQTLLRELEEPPVVRIYYSDSTPLAFSIIPLRHLSNHRVEEFDSIHDGIRAFIGRSRRQQSLLEEKERLRRFFARGIERAERTLRKMEEETRALERAAGYELFGKLLMANLHQLGRGMRKVTLEQLFSSDREPVTIPLDPGLTPAENAERYFEKAKSARSSIEEKLHRKQGVQVEWEELQSLQDEFESVQTLQQLTDYLSTHAERLAQVGYETASSGPHRRGPAGTTMRKESVPFRVFTVEGGFEVWVGKSSENNDLLTMKYAKPNDLWFHARGSSGSHVVLKVGTGRGQPSKRALEQAAAVAAYYSKMKTAKHVPVAMTLRKYVRKPRGAPAGTVTIERERLWFVEPGLPR